MADQDSKFTKSFTKLLERKNISLRYQTGVTKNAYIERQGYEIKKNISSLSRKLGRPWPEVVEEAIGILNNTKIKNTPFTPLAAYENGNYAKLLRMLQEREPYRILSLYDFIPLTEKGKKIVFQFDLGEKVRVDTTPVTPALQQHFFKQSEGRRPIWREGEVEARRLAQTARNTLVQRYLVRIIATKKAFWAYENNLRHMPLKTE